MLKKSNTILLQNSDVRIEWNLIVGKVLNTEFTVFSYLALDMSAPLLVPLFPQN